MFDNKVSVAHWGLLRNGEKYFDMTIVTKFVNSNLSSTVMAFDYYFFSVNVHKTQQFLQIRFSARIMNSSVCTIFYKYKMCNYVRNVMKNLDLSVESAVDDLIRAETRRWC